jgi:hypothetical protein
VSEAPTGSLWNLTRDEFARALRRGLGRAILYLRTHDSEPVLDLVRDACVRDVAFSWMEETREAYLRGVIISTGRIPELRRMVLDALPVAHGPRDTGQLLSLAAEFAKRGDPEARAATYAAFDRNESGEPFRGGFDLIDLDGTSALLHIAERVGDELAPECQWKARSWVHRARKTAGAETVDCALAAAAASSARVAAFVRVVEAGERSHAEWVAAPKERPIPSYTEVKATLLAPPDSAEGATARRARVRTESEEERAAIAADLLTTESPALLREIARFYRINRRLPFVADVGPYLARARSDVRAIADATRTALAQSDDPRVRDLAESLLREGDVGRETLLLLDRHLRPEDHFVIEQALAKSPLASATDDDAEVHDVCIGILNLYAKRPTDESVSLMAWVYEHTPCSACREDAVGALARHRALSPAIVEEAALDASEKTRKVVARYVRGT